MRFSFTSRSRFSIILIATVFIAIGFSCSDKTEDLVTDQLSDYKPLTTGKYITYRLDSLVFTNFGRNIETHRYQVKHVVDAQITDNLGRSSYRVFTYIRDSAGTQNWIANGTYFVTPLDKTTEVIEDNLRVVKLHLPIKEGYEWKGNSYLPFDPYGNTYDFSNDDDMKSWDFSYNAVEPTFTYRGQTYNDVLTVAQEDDSFNAPVTDPNNYGYKTLSEEKYSKGIGLVYRKYELWEYQPNVSGPSPYRTGFGITMWMIDHN
jgi:hypothetical protein